jgi:hypothetical protein
MEWLDSTDMNRSTLAHSVLYLWVFLIPFTSIVGGSSYTHIFVNIMHYEFLYLIKKEMIRECKNIKKCHKSLYFLGGSPEYYFSSEFYYCYDELSN